VRAFKYVAFKTALTPPAYS